MQRRWRLKYVLILSKGKGKARVTRSGTRSVLSQQIHTHGSYVHNNIIATLPRTLQHITSHYQISYSAYSLLSPPSNNYPLHIPMHIRLYTYCPATVWYRKPHEQRAFPLLSGLCNVFQPLDVVYWSHIKNERPRKRVHAAGEVFKMPESFGTGAGAD